MKEAANWAALHLLRNPSSIAALTFEHVKFPSGRRVKHARGKLGLLAAFYAAWRGRFLAISFFHAAHKIPRRPYSQVK
jgi:hypothetical protein